MQSSAAESTDVVSRLEDATGCNSSIFEAAIRAERDWLRLTTLRFFSSSTLRSAWPKYLLGLYHAMDSAVGLMHIALARSRALAGECAVAARLVDYWDQHIREETGHADWLLADMRRFGIDTDLSLQAPPAPEVAELIGTLHFWTQQQHPVAPLAYFYIVERSPPPLPLLEWLVERAGIPRATLETFHRHAVIDVAHGRDLQKLMDELPLMERHHELLAVSGRTALRQLARITEKLLSNPE